MSVEPLLISAVVDEGPSAVRKVYAEGVTADFLELYAEEWLWLEQRILRRKPITLRALKERFPDFEYARSKGETIQDLARELKEEVALSRTNQIMATIAESANKDNIIEMLLEAREEITRITRAHAPMSDVDLDDVEPVIEEMRQRRVLAHQGQGFGYPTGIPHFDHYVGGLVKGQFVMLSGRTGSTKSYVLMMMAWGMRKHGLNVGVFSPEFNAHEVRCRYHTLASADKRIQQELSLMRSFGNKALMRGTAFNMKTYTRFMEHVREMPGSMHLLCGAGMKDQMSVAYIEDRLVEHELDVIFVDPIYLLKPVRLHREGNTYQEVAWVGEALHRLGEQYDVPIVFTNQAHLDGNKGDAPGMEKSYGAKSLLHISDWVIGVQYMSEENKLVLRATKGRFGEDFRSVYTFFPDTGFFDTDTPLPRGYANGNGNGHHDESEDVVRKATKGRAKVRST